MKALADIILPEDRLYTHEHIWAKKDGDTFLLGISDFAQDQLGEIVYVEMPSEGDSFSANDDFGTVESVKSVNKLFMPFDGSIVEFNSEVDDTPTTLNADCYEKGWIVRVKANNAADYETMHDVAAYKEFLAK